MSTTTDLEIQLAVARAKEEMRMRVRGLLGLCSLQVSMVLVEQFHRNGETLAERLDEFAQDLVQDCGRPFDTCVRDIIGALTEKK